MHSIPRFNPEHTLARFPSVKALPRGSYAPFSLVAAIVGDDCTSATVQTAEALAEHRGATPSLLYVMELTPVATMEGGIGAAVMTQMLLDPVRHAENKQSLRASCHVDTGIPATWPFTLDLGNAASSIVRHAEHSQAQLVIMGMHRHGAVDHILGEDTLRNVVANGTTPVLAVRPNFVALPSTIVVAMDFSVASLRAARLARHMLADTGTLHLIFVEPIEADMVSEQEQGRRFIEASGVETAFHQVRTMLDPAPGMTITSTRRFGNPIDELKAICAELRPDVVAIGSQRHPFIERLFVGTVTSAMIRDGGWSLLITPPAVR